MRTENQIKRKLNELIMLQKTIESKRESAAHAQTLNESEVLSLQVQAEKLEESISLLEWVLDAPVGKYHA